MIDEKKNNNMNDYVYVILINDCDILIPIGYERNLDTAKRKVHLYLELSDDDVSDIPVYDIGKEVTSNGIVICRVPYHGIDEYLHEVKYV